MVVVDVVLLLLLLLLMMMMMMMMMMEMRIMMNHVGDSFVGMKDVVFVVEWLMVLLPPMRIPP